MCFYETNEQSNKWMIQAGYLHITSFSIYSSFEQVFSMGIHCDFLFEKNASVLKL